MDARLAMCSWDTCHVLVGLNVAIHGRRMLLRSIRLGFENKKRPRPKRSQAVVDRCRPGRTRQPLLRRPQLFDWLIAETGSLLETSALMRWCL